jgi:hypothetical protein
VNGRWRIKAPKKEEEEEEKRKEATHPPDFLTWPGTST